MGAKGVLYFTYWDDPDGQVRVRKRTNGHEMRNDWAWRCWIAFLIWADLVCFGLNTVWIASEWSEQNVMVDRKACVYVRACFMLTINTVTTTQYNTTQHIVHNTM
jgi:hypothetical protein